MIDAYIFDAVRTPRGRGKPSGGLHAVSPIDLVKTSLAGLRERNRLDTALVDDVILGCVEPVKDQGANIARVGALYSGYAESVAGTQVNRFCASGLEACNLAAATVKAGQHDLVIGGGVEHMSRVPMLSAGGAWPADPEVAVPLYFIPQGVSADLLATKFGFTRSELDGFAVESHRRATRAWEEGRFSRSVLPVKDGSGLTVLDRDEHVRPDASLSSLSQLSPSFAALAEMAGFDQVALQRYPELERIEHVHHAGNSSGIVDGAAAVLIGSEAAGRRANLSPRARFVSFAAVGTEPTIMLTGPEWAAKKALARAGMAARDIDIWEVNEAFAAVVLRFMQALPVDRERVNPNGGAIALGHPLGATGAMLLGTALDELERTGLKTALVTLCVGAGMGVATIIERV